MQLQEEKQTKNLYIMEETDDNDDERQKFANYISIIVI